MPSPLVSQPRHAPRHFVNQCILELKTGGSRPDRKADMFLLVHDILHDELLLQAKRRFGENARELAGRAAAKAINDIRSCPMYLDSYSHERNLLTAVVRQYNRRYPEQVADAVPDAGTAEEAWPEWLRVLLHLLWLSRRSWLYLWLYPLRDGSWGYLGRLTELYLGARRQPALALLRAEQRQVQDELSEAFDALARASGRPKDPVEGLFYDLNDTARNWDGVSRRSLSTALLNRICDWRPSRPPSDANLEIGLREIQRVLGPIRDLAVEAVEQLIVETASPGGRLIDTPIQRVLDNLRSDHGHEHSVAHVLAGIEALPVPAVPPEAPWVRLSRSDLLQGIVRKVDGAEPGLDCLRLLVLVGLVQCATPQELAERVQFYLTHPVLRIDPWTAVRSGLLQDVIQVLEWWAGLAARWTADAAANREDPISSWCFLEVPRMVRDRPQVLDDALTLLRNWSGHPDVVPNDWAALPNLMQELIAYALLSLIWDDLVSQMVSCY